MKEIKKAFAITDAKISFVSLVDKAANQREFLIAKAKEGEKSFATLGRIVKADNELHHITGIVYEPMVEDAHDNYMTEEEIQKAAYWFAKNGDKIDMQHNFEECDACTVVETWVAKADFSLDDEPIKKGTWLMTVEIADDDIWQKVEKKEITGFSMGGIGKYSAIDDDIEPVEKGGKTVMEQPEKKNIFKRMAEAFGSVGFDLVEKGEMQETYAERQKGSGFWNATDTLTQLLANGHWDYRSDRWVYDFESDEAKIREALTEFSEIITSLLSSENIAKSLVESAPAQPITKAGKKMSGKNKQRLDDICQAISAFQKEFDENNNDDEEDTQVNKEAIQKMVDEAVTKAVGTSETPPAAEPIADAPVTAEAVQKMIEQAVAKAVADNTPAPTVTETADLAAMIDEAVAKALAPVFKSRGLPSNLNDNPAPVQKAEQHYLAGIL